MKLTEDEHSEIEWKAFCAVHGNDVIMSCTLFVHFDANCYSFPFLSLICIHSNYTTLTAHILLLITRVTHILMYLVHIHAQLLRLSKTE